MSKTVSKFALAAGLVLAMVFTAGCAASKVAQDILCSLFAGLRTAPQWCKQAVCFSIRKPLGLNPE